MILKNGAVLVAWLSMLKILVCHDIWLNMNNQLLERRRLSRVKSASWATASLPRQIITTCGKSNQLPNFYETRHIRKTSYAMWKRTVSKKFDQSRRRYAMWKRTVSKKVDQSLRQWYLLVLDSQNKGTSCSVNVIRYNTISMIIIILKIYNTMYQL